MKKTYLKSLKVFLTLLLLCGVCNAWGESTVLFHETFGDNSGSARAWSDTYSVKSGVYDVYSSVSYTMTNVKQGKNTTGQTKSGLNQSSQNVDAVFEFGPLDVSDYKDLSLSYYWKAASIGKTYTTNIYYKTSKDGSYNEVTHSASGATTFVEVSVNLPEAAAKSSTLYLKIVFNTSNTQAIIDEVELKGQYDTPTKTLESIAVTTLPEKKVYKVGESFDTKGLVVTGTYTDDSSEPLSPTQYSLSTPDMSSAGQKTVTVSAKDEIKTTFTIDVVALDKIEITTSPTTTEYNEGDNFDPAGMVVKGTWGTEVGKTIVEDNLTGYTITDGTNLQPSQTFVTVSYTHAGTTKTTTQDITVTAATNKYAVTFESDTEEGTLTVKVGDVVITTGTELVEGVKVYLASTPKEGYKQQATPFVVKDADGGVISVKTENGQKYFEMPAKAVTITAKFVAVYAINVAGGIQGGTIAIQDKDGNPITETSKGSKVVIAVTPVEHYSLKSLECVKEGTEERVNIDESEGEYSFTMPASAVSVTATFAEDAKYTVTFSINGVNTPSDANYAGEPVVFPDDPSVEGYTFMGWTAEAINGTQQTTPTFVNKETAVYPTNNNTLYYAVFAKKEGSENYVKVTTVTDGQYLIVNEASNRAFDGNDKADDYVNVTISNSEITDPNDAAIVEIKAMTGGYSLEITNGDNADKYIYGKSGSNSIQYGTTAVASTITITDGAAKIENNSTYFCYNANSGNDRFRFYKSTTTGDNYILPALYKKQEATYSDYCTFIPAEVTITAAKYATLGLPYAVEIPEGVSAYTATVEGTTVEMSKINKSEGGSNVIPANCGVILYADVNVATTYTFYGTTTEESYPDNKLVAALEDYTCPEADKDLVYYLGKDGDNAVFKKLTVGGTIAAGKAYLQLDEPLTAGAKLEVTFDDETTGITSYENDNENENLKSMTVYNLNGMKVNEAYKGIVIMNGKKYINK